MSNEISVLLQSSEATIRYKTLVKVLNQEPSSLDLQKLQKEIPSSTLVKTLFSERDYEGKIPHHPYNKWRGAHWVLACLADLGYPPGDESLKPLLEQVYHWLLSQHHLKSVEIINNRARRCASQEGNALYYALTLGLDDERCQELAERLIQWQWPDGGWNCDKKPEAINASYHESLIPLRALALYNQASGDGVARQAAERAAEIFLKRELFKRQRDGSLINEDFVLLHYPCYWHYDILFGLKVMAESGFISDKRCQAALDLVESKRLPTGGFPAEKKYYQLSQKASSGRSLVNWGGAQKKRMNEFVSVDALYVLKSAGRL
jgi:hypothetical protein